MGALDYTYKSIIISEHKKQSSLEENYFDIVSTSLDRGKAEE
jgi:hypothetical protein